MNIHPKEIPMSSPITLRTGPVTQADGTNPQARAGKTAEIIVSQCHGKYFEASHRGVLFVAGTPAGGVAPGTSVGTTGAFILENPKGSGKRLAVKKVTMAYQGGTLGAGLVWHCANTNPAAAAVTSGTAVTPTNVDLSNGGSAVGKPNSGGTLPASATQLYPFASLPAQATSTAAAPCIASEDVDGAIVIEPGTQYSLQAEAAAGTSPKVSFGVVWEEIPIV
jgi:hypothetical protein